jgi:hypothetical protein
MHRKSSLRFVRQFYFAFVRSNRENGEAAAENFKHHLGVIVPLSELYHPTFLVDEAQDAFKNEDFCTI